MPPPIQARFFEKWVQRCGPDAGVEFPLIVNSLCNHEMTDERLRIVVDESAARRPGSHFYFKKSPAQGFASAVERSHAITPEDVCAYESSRACQRQTTARNR